MSETGYKAVTLELKSPWVRNADQITYSVGDTFEAAHAGSRGIYVLPSLAAAVRRAKRFSHLKRTRFLEVTYELADVYEENGDGLSVAAVTVVDEATP